MKFNVRSVKFKIVIYTSVCIVLVGLMSNLFLYSYLHDIIMDRTEELDELYFENIQNQLNSSLTELWDLMLSCSKNTSIAKSMRDSAYGTAGEQSAHKENVKKIMSENVKSNISSRYIIKMIMFNDYGTSIHSDGVRSHGFLSDYQNIQDSELFQNYLESSSSKDLTFTNYVPSITPNIDMCLAGIYSVNAIGITSTAGYLYAEIDPEIITDIFKDYQGFENLFVLLESGEIITENDEIKTTMADVELDEINSNETVTINGRRYRFQKEELAIPGFTLYEYTDLTDLRLDPNNITFTVIMVILTSLLVAVGVAVISSNYITRPLKKLSNHIRRISIENDLSYDPEIEKSNDEIGEIGKVVNEMSASIQSLLDETIERSEQQKDIEIALLQSQVNPHFLYNTLDSIRWMAVVQKNTGICNITRSLINLLKNMSKGYSHKVTLQEELELLNDYITIQAIRYLETFEVVNNIDQKYYQNYIIKMTLQPIVENAIFHGIEPTGTCGTITLDAYEEGDYFYITIHDNGVGMTEEDIHKLLFSKTADSHHTMNGIGVSNVHERLRLTYGSECGLSIKSEVNSYTKVTIKIRKERNENV